MMLNSRTFGVAVVGVFSLVFGPLACGTAEEQVGTVSSADGTTTFKIPPGQVLIQDLGVGPPIGGPCVPMQGIDCVPPPNPWPQPVPPQDAALAYFTQFTGDFENGRFAHIDLGTNGHYFLNAVNIGGGTYMTLTVETPRFMADLGYTQAQAQVLGADPFYFSHGPGTGTGTITGHAGQFCIWAGEGGGLSEVPGQNTSEVDDNNPLGSGNVKISSQYNGTRGTGVSTFMWCYFNASDVVGDPDEVLPTGTPLGFGNPFCPDGVTQLVRCFVNGVSVGAGQSNIVDVGVSPATGNWLSTGGPFPEVGWYNCIGSLAGCP